MAFPGLTVAAIRRLRQATEVFFYVLPPVIQAIHTHTHIHAYTCTHKAAHVRRRWGQVAVRVARLTSTSPLGSRHYNRGTYSHIECPRGERLHRWNTNHNLGKPRVDLGSSSSLLRLPYTRNLCQRSKHCSMDKIHHNRPNRYSSLYLRSLDSGKSTTSQPPSRPTIV